MAGQDDRGDPAESQQFRDATLPHLYATCTLADGTGLATQARKQEVFAVRIHSRPS
jgi:hypothetical protein